LKRILKIWQSIDYWAGWHDSSSFHDQIYVFEQRHQKHIYNHPQNFVDIFVFCNNYFWLYTNILHILISTRIRMTFYLYFFVFQLWSQNVGGKYVRFFLYFVSIFKQQLVSWYIFSIAAWMSVSKLYFQMPTFAAV
jgi:hypothetical protein